MYENWSKVRFSPFHLIYSESFAVLKAGNGKAAEQARCNNCEEEPLPLPKDPNAALCLRDLRDGLRIALFSRWPFHSNRRVPALEGHVHAALPPRSFLQSFFAPPTPLSASQSLLVLPLSPKYLSFVLIPTTRQMLSRHCLKMEQAGLPNVVLGIRASYSSRCSLIRIPTSLITVI
ncbi:hypothetical protein BDP27DRAFT_606917 [Rhodocollybia butyracea]|uniref:Uncharacterized protein n=1 Tax=Rhodocollybia butyracea TaxID=206335 RepID=A0A9P5QBE2_9AGAR|nr:hypothetical protein BDP27DRAFT_606917 [Rhodocollybia butyracea]